MVKKESPTDMALRIIRIAELLAKKDMPRNAEATGNSSLTTRNDELDVKFDDQSQCQTNLADKNKA